MKKKGSLVDPLRKQRLFWRYKQMDQGKGWNTEVLEGLVDISVQTTFHRIDR